MNADVILHKYHHGEMIATEEIIFLIGCVEKMLGKMDQITLTNIDRYYDEIIKKAA